MTSTPPTIRSQVPTASRLDTVRAVGAVLLPVAARGAIVRRPRAVALAQHWDADARAVRQLQRLPIRYGPGPLQLRLPRRRLTLLLEPQQVHWVLNGSPTPFAVATREKRRRWRTSSRPVERSHRRQFNEAVLHTGQPLHRLTDPMTAAVRQEAELLLEQVDHTGALAWQDFSVAWWRAARRVVLGDSARDDEQTTDQLLRLRQQANWSFTAPQRTALRRRFLTRVQGYVDRAEPGSLASLVHSTAAHP